MAKNYDLSAIAATPIEDPIPKDELEWAIQRPPFVNVPGTINFRTLGPATKERVQLRPNVVYRSGNLGRITEAGKVILTKELGIKKVFDLRGARELKGSAPPSIDGVEIVWVDSHGLQPSKVEPAGFAVDEKKAYTDMYINILETYKPAYKGVLNHILNEPGVPFVFHCTGKDRTGVLVALLLSIAGFTSTEIAKDYALTRIGVEVAREMLLTIMVRDQGVDLDTPGMKEVSGIKAQNMLAFLEALETRYSGAEGYVKESLGFSEDNVQKIKEALLEPVHTVAV